MIVNKSETNRYIYIEYLRVFATLAVIVVHVSGNIVRYFNGVEDHWWIANCFDSSMRFCVPIFVMLSGALLIPKVESIFVFFYKRLNRILLPFAFWSSIYIGYELFHKLSEGNITLIATVKLIFIRISLGASYHLWYIYMIIGLYLFMPIIGKWARNSNSREILYFLLIWFTILFIEPFYPKFINIMELKSFTGFIGYLVLGYYLSSFVGKSKKVNIISLLLILLGLAITIFGTYLISVHKNIYIFSNTFYQYLSPNIVIMSIGLFLIIKNNFEHQSFIITSIAKYSFGIYLAHVFVLIALTKVGITGNLWNPILGIPFTTILCLFLSCGIVYLISKMPFGIYISG